VVIHEKFGSSGGGVKKRGPRSQTTQTAVKGVTKSTQQAAEEKNIEQRNNTKGRRKRD